ncbi:MAG: 50S ribosomal protein L15 [Thermoflexibacter sp.]
MNLHTLKPAEGSVRKNKRLGRGQGSGKGGTSTRGHKGAQSRSGYSKKLGFEGGQMPLQRRIPKYGFNNPNRVEYKAINIDVVQQLIEKTNTNKVDIELLVVNGLASKNDKIKILGRGTLSAGVEVVAHAFSSSAIEQIEKVGGKATKIGS